MNLFFIVILSLCVTFTYEHGGPHEAKKHDDDAEIQTVISFAMRKLNDISNNYYRYMALTTLVTAKQVGKGIKYCVAVDVGSSSKCSKQSTNVHATLKECPVDTKEMECRFLVSKQMFSGEDQLRLLDHKCSTEDHLTCDGESKSIFAKNVKDDTLV
ncbi:uncharacterized protein LOC124444010 [Xenia sp. Carnegie-2017]|uniref:uncharacterized protein LOC124444010 n=1 Tax=Xenia sp. Carnegie-2017 TaxID=2897299 RepID=UPI001F034247|nr:uncharacterized protein LOC124444010 [Xenia sp. Carnegie-2017]